MGLKGLKGLKRRVRIWRVGFNPFYSPSLHFMVVLDEAMREGKRVLREEIRREFRGRAWD